MSQEREKPTSRNIPLPMQRAIRQRCGFGCVVCGLPLYVYEHMEGWAITQRHVAEEITLLCDMHEKERTNGLLPMEAVRTANAEPFNFKKGVSKPYDLHFRGDVAEVEIGGNSFSMQYGGYGTCLIPLSIDGTPLIAFILGDDHLLLNLVLFDEFNSPVLHIKNNQLFYSISPWDIQLVGTRLTVREAHRKLLIEINFQPPSRAVVSKGRFLRNGVEVLVRENNILITNSGLVIGGNKQEGAPAGLIIGPHDGPLPCFMSLRNVPRYLGDRKEALQFERECFATPPS